MPSPLPDPPAIARDINAAGKVGNSIKWLVDNAGQLSEFASVADWVVATGGEGPVGYHLTQVRTEVARQLWTRHLLVGVTVIDEFLFSAIGRGSQDPILDLMVWLSTSPLMNPSYVIYPLHSFGLQREGIMLQPDQSSSEPLARTYGIAVSAQHRDIQSVAAWLRQVHDWFDIGAGVPIDLLRHWSRSRAAWVESNPLLVVRIHTLSGGDYYENQRLLTDRLHMATAFLGGLAIKQPVVPVTDASRLFSTSRVNNWATLDIHHYFVMDATLDESGALTGDAIPMSVESGYLAELSDLPVDLNMAYWTGNLTAAAALWEALSTLADLSVEARFQPRRRSDARIRTARKMFESADYFRRSLAADRWHAVASLGTAFEMLLTTKYEKGVTQRLRRRAEKLTGSVETGRAVAALYEARSALVHSGQAPPEDLEIEEAQRAYLTCLEILTSRLDRVTPRETDPLRGMSDDDPADPYQHSILRRLSRRLRPGAPQPTGREAPR